MHAPSKMWHSQVLLHVEMKMTDQKCPQAEQREKTAESRAAESVK